MEHGKACNTYQNDERRVGRASSDRVVGLMEANSSQGSPDKHSVVETDPEGVTACSSEVDKLRKEKDQLLSEVNLLKYDKFPTHIS
jgi:hypothetical protein